MAFETPFSPEGWVSNSIPRYLGHYIKFTYWLDIIYATKTFTVSPEDTLELNDYIKFVLLSTWKNLREIKLSPADSQLVGFLTKQISRKCHLSHYNTNWTNKILTKFLLTFQPLQTVMNIMIKLFFVS